LWLTLFLKFGIFLFLILTSFLFKSFFSFLSSQKLIGAWGFHWDISQSQTEEFLSVWISCIGNPQILEIEYHPFGEQEKVPIQKRKQWEGNEAHFPFSRRIFEIYQQLIPQAEAISGWFFPLIEKITSKRNETKRNRTEQNKNKPTNKQAKSQKLKKLI